MSQIRQTKVDSNSLFHFSNKKILMLHTTFLYEANRTSVLDFSWDEKMAYLNLSSNKFAANDLSSPQIVGVLADL